MKFKIFKFKKVKSTNNTAIRIIRETNYNLGMVIAETQSKGRGQYGRKWISTKGNLFVSFFNELNKTNLSINAITNGYKQASGGPFNVFKTVETAQKFMDLINEKILAIDNLRDYCNKRFAKISITYNQSVTNIDELWSFKSKKFKISEIED